MAPVPVRQPPEATSGETVEQRFRRLEAIWRAETAVLSDSGRIVNHPAFQEIIALGEPVIPLMLRDLERAPHAWVWALPRITGTNPVPPAEAGNMTRMSEAWVRWGKENGCRW
jgi:hypothetical protein